MRLALAVVVALLLVVPAAAVDLTEGPTGAFGFVGRYPQEPFGVSLLYFRPGAIGFYADAKFGPGITEGDDYYENISVQLAESWGDPRTDTQTNPLTVNIGVTWPLTSKLGAYAGGGMTWKTTLHEYYDPMHILSDDGHYWIDGSEETEVNFLGGLVFFAGNSWGLQFGAEGPEFGVTLGVFWSGW